MQQSCPRKVLVIRHGERCDYFFRRRGINWMEEFINNSKKHSKSQHEQIPEFLPMRNDGLKAYCEDTPLTARGYKASVDAGRLLQDCGITIDFLYVSPSFRCVQTAKGILDGLEDNKLEMFVEPGLYQWMHWCENIAPKFMSLTDLKQAGYPISDTYKTFDNVKNFKMDESLDDYYERSHSLMKYILTRHTEGTILCVAHAGSLNTLTQQLCNKSPLILEDFIDYLKGISYLSCEEIEEQEDYSWKSLGSPIPELSNSGLDRY